MLFNDPNISRYTFFTILFFKSNITLSLIPRFSVKLSILETKAFNILVKSELEILRLSISSVETLEL